jgi:hypothetical protein
MRTLTQLSSAIVGAKANRELYQRLADEATEKVGQLKAETIHLEEAQAFLIKVAQDTQNQLRFHIQDIVQMALDVCFPGGYVFQVAFEVKRGVTTAELFFLKNETPVNPIDAAGGGVVDVASFALRIAAWALSTTRPVIVLDEPFRFLSKDLQPKAGQILQALSTKLGLQLIMVTHEASMVDAADRVFEVKMVGDRSQVVIR